MARPSPNTTRSAPAAWKDLERLRRRDARDDVDDRGHPPRRVAGGAGAGSRALAQDAAKAGRDPRSHQQGETVGPHAGPVDPGNAGPQADVVEKVAGLEVVGAVEDEVLPAHEALRVLRGEVGHEAAHLDLGVETAQARLGGRGLGQAEPGVLLVEQGLALQVRGLDEVAVHYGER